MDIDLSKIIKRTETSKRYVPHKRGCVGKTFCRDYPCEGNCKLADGEMPKPPEGAEVVEWEV